MKKQFYLILNKQVFDKYLFTDLIGQENIIVHEIKKTKQYSLFFGKRNPFAKILRKLKLDKFFINNLFFYSPSFYKFDKKKDNIMIVMLGALKHYPFEYLEKLRKKHNLKLVLLLLDSLHAETEVNIRFKDVIFNNKWDAVYTYDKFDAKEFNFRYNNMCYFSTSILPKPVKETKNDIYFIAGIRGNREKEILDIIKKFESEKINYYFDIYCYEKIKEDKIIKTDHVNYFTNKWKTYDEVLEEIKQTNCILEILRANQKSQSIRYFEALYFNKKLLTNNPNIVNLPYYDSRYMKYFNDIDDIDFEWINKKEDINYNYKNDFTPLNFIKQLEREM